MQFLGNTNDTSNRYVGVLLLIILLVMAVPTLLPRYLSQIIPGVDEAMPCANLQTSENRASHQSLIGQVLTNPLSVNVAASALPTAPGEKLVILIILENTKPGTIPIVYEPGQVISGDNGTSGPGVIFSPPAGITLGNRAGYGPTVPQSAIHLLGPYQRCVHRIELDYVELNQQILSGNTQVSSFYRIASAGVAQPSPDEIPVFTDQGLDIVPGGIITSGLYLLR